MDDARDLSNPMFTRPPLILRINKLEKREKCKIKRKKQKANQHNPKNTKAK